MPRRATTLRFVGVDVAARADVPYVLVPVAAARDVFVRGTTRRPVDNFVVFTTVSIGFEDRVALTPGFRFVRIWLFMYGYM